MRQLPLDSKAEVVVQEALDKMIDQQSHGCTLIIAHRLSTLRSCDRILVMDKGCLKESGSHHDLMKIEVKKDAKGNMITGWYRDLYETQHGKDNSKNEVESLREKLQNLERELMKVKECNAALKKDAVAGFKLCKFQDPSNLGPTLAQRLPHLLPPLALARQSSDPSTTFCKAQGDAAAPPPPLDLDRVHTTPF